MEEPSPAPRCRPPPATTMAAVPGSKMAAPTTPPQQDGAGEVPCEGAAGLRARPCGEGLSIHPWPGACSITWGILSFYPTGT